MRELPVGVQGHSGGERTLSRPFSVKKIDTNTKSHRTSLTFRFMSFAQVESCTVQSAVFLGVILAAYLSASIALSAFSTRRLVRR